MARVTVEDCIDKVDSPYELVLVAKERATQLNSGIEPTIDRDNDKNTVISLREIAEENIKVSSEVETEVGDANEEDKMIHDRATYCSETSDTIEEDELLRHNDTNMLAIVGQITKPSSDSSTQILSEGYPELWVTAMVIFISLLWLNC